MPFTGDSLLIRVCVRGRMDFQDGDPEALLRSVIERLFSLPPDTVVYRAHDYRRLLFSTIAD
ncbi:unnamed protein product [Chondrus crispus]|uniref:Uncharacterized protein n=1 Tax=Chondrus crispus TaxID=2769 RepID=R7QMF6_CHOCR|nr:unnamed protein product [Chondrus crispus]CDF38661.1 unnamed protein product [Chondrus crispus]|eukprot:XP_005718566.1 unnamed protein product [Chondrus crispus]